MNTEPSINIKTIYPTIPVEYINTLRPKQLVKVKETIKLIRKELIRGELVHMCNILYCNTYDDKSKNLTKSQYDIFYKIIQLTLDSRCKTEGSFSTFSTLYYNINKSNIRTVAVLLNYRLGWLDKLTRYINKILKERNI